MTVTETVTKELRAALDARATDTHEPSDWWPGDHRAACKEGWDVFDCDGSDFGQWQINRVDEADEGDVQLNSDDEAWRIVLEGSGPHHVSAREFIKKHTPVHWWEICRTAELNGVDKSKLSPELLVECMAAILGPKHPEYPG